MEVNKKMYRCPYCIRNFASQQGRRSHVTQVLDCQKKHQAMIANIGPVDDNGNETDDSHEESGDEPAGSLQFDPWVDDDPLIGQGDPGPNITFGKQVGDSGVQDPEPAKKQAKRDHATGHRCPGNEQPRWIEPYPGQVGTRIRKSATFYEKLKAHREMGAKGTRWEPFGSDADWELARWALTSGVTHSAVDKLLELPIVS